MLSKIQIFILCLLGIGQVIKNKVITYISYDIYKEFSIVFFITLFMYFIVEKLLNRFDISFNNIEPVHKKMYVIKNYIKSFFLAGLCTQLVYFLDLLNGTLDLIFIKRCTIYYIMNDIIGLLLVKKLPTTTKIHHITTSLCGLATIAKQSTNMDILTLIVLYAVFSSMSFCVNFYLGFRVYSINDKLKKLLSIISFWVYITSCIICWIFQANLAYIVIPTIPIWQSLIYFAFLYSVGRDDIILMKWLKDDWYNKK